MEKDMTTKVKRVLVKNQNGDIIYEGRFDGNVFYQKDMRLDKHMTEKEFMKKLDFTKHNKSKHGMLVSCDEISTSDDWSI